MPKFSIVIPANSSETISIIVPVYNIRNYVARCAESILKQTYEDIELLLVNDGSTDDSLQICRAVQMEDARVRIITKPNGGLSSARNAGIEAAGGKYLMFIDGDDWIAPDMAQILYDLMHSCEADIAECAYCTVGSDMYRFTSPASGAITVTDSLGALNGMLDWKNFFPMVWNKLYKRFIVGDIRFPVGRLHEDEFTTHRFYLNARRIAAVDAVKYYYDQTREGSITAKFNLKRLDAVHAFRERMHLIWQNGLEPIEKKMNDNYAWTLFTLLVRCFKAGLSGPEVDAVIENALCDWRDICANGRPLEYFYEAHFKALQSSPEAFFKAAKPVFDTDA